MLKNIRQSLITRLMIYFLLASFVLVLLFSINIAFGLKVHFKNEILPNIAQYLVYIKDDIGTPPNLEKAKLLSEKLSIKMLIKGPDLNWQSNAISLDINDLDFEAAPMPYRHFKIAHRLKHNLILLQQGDYQYYFSVRPLAGSASYTRNIGLMVVFVIFMAVLFFVIRKSLKPLNVISQGVKEIAKGNLDSTIKVQNSFEFEQLANGINMMAGEINIMLEAKQQLLLAISHELRSPITRAQVNLALLPEDDVQKALKHDLVEMEQLISQILETQRLSQTHGALNKTNFQFDELIQQVIKTYFESENIEVTLEPITIYADHTRFMLLIKNLIDNALKYSEHTNQSPEIHLSIQNNQIICRIKDFGIGMKSTDLDKIIQAFYRIDQARQRSTGGFGLGLYLCHLIVKAHHATMSFESELAKGTTVSVLIPKSF